MINTASELEEESEVDEAFGELLANLVQSHPCLYDKTCTKYKDKNFVADTWASIAATCNMSTNLIQKQWKTLRGQFTREHRQQKIYEPSGTGNNTSKRPRKTWYLYQTLLFLVPHITHRKTCSNFVRKKSISTTESSLSFVPSTSQSVSNSASQLPLGPMMVTVPSISPSDSSSNIWDSDIYNDDSNVLTQPPETSSSISAVSQSSPLTIAKQNLLTPPPDKSAVRKMKKSCKEQDILYKTIADTNDVIKMTMSRLADKCSKPTKENDEEENIIGKAISYALKKVDMTYRMQCYIECLTIIQKYQNMATEDVVKNL